jgi:NADH-quinone oxidoreductase subunit J
MMAIIFYSFSALLLAAALLVVLFNNTILSILSLLVVFIAAVGLWLLLGAEFLSLALIFIYVGAMIVLFLCAVMLLNLSAQQKQIPQKIVFIAGIIFSLVLAVIVAYLEKSQHFGLLAVNQSCNNLKAIGDVLYTNYWLALLAAGVLLLIAAVGTIKLIVID